MDPQLKNKVVIITGASSGIGKGTAIRFAELGCRLSLVARRRERLDETAAACTAAGAPEVLICCHDISVEEECVAVVQETAEKFKEIDVLVNNAGDVCKFASFAETSSEDFHRMMNINTRAAMTLIQQSIPHLTKTKGSIVNISSIMGSHATPGMAAYSMSKAALDMITRLTAQEFAGAGVRVNSVHPGVIHTEIFDKTGMDDEVQEAFIKKTASIHSLGRLGSIDEVANSIIFLASSLAGFTTGQILFVDGGFHDTTKSEPLHTTYGNY